MHTVSRFRTLWQQLQDRARSGGPMYAAQGVLNRIIPKRLFSINVIELQEHNLCDVRRGDTANVRWGTPEDLDSLVRFKHSREKLLARFERGLRVIILELGGEVAGWQWYEDNSHDDFGWLRFKLSAGDIWAFDALVAPDQRGKGIFARMRRFSATELSKAGYRRIVGWHDALNRSSLRARTKTGSRPLGRIYWLRFLTVTCVYDGRSIRIGRWSPRRRLELPVAIFGNEDGS